MRERNQFDCALQYLEEGVALAGVFGQLGAMSGDIAMSQIYWEQGDFHKAQLALDHARELAEAFDLTIIDDLFVEMYQAWLWLVQGKLDAVQEWLKNRGLDQDEADDSLIEDDERRFIYQRVHKYEMMVAARAMIRSGEPEKVNSRLDRLLVWLEEQDRGKLALEARMLKALALQAMGEQEQAVDILAVVLKAAAHEGYIRLFIDEGEPMRRLLAGTLPGLTGETRHYAAQLLSVFAGLENPSETIHPQSFESVSLVEPLSRREMDILQLLESSLTSNEIAEKLMVSVHTVRSHIKRIYGKLGVHNRTAAVTQARELNIL